MLDTRMPPISTRPRRSYPSAQSGASARPARSQAQAAPVREHVPTDSVRRALPSARSSRLSRSEMRLMGLATTCTAVVCALLLLYLAAYAQVTQLGIAQASARTELRRSQLHSQLLQAECNTLESPQRITAAAAAAGMVPRGRTPVNYVAAQPLTKDIARDTSTQEANLQDINAQGNYGGTTEDSRAAAPFGH